MLTRRRMPSVYDHLQLVVRAQNSESIEDDFKELDGWRTASTRRIRRDPLEYTLNISRQLQVVAIFTLLPPSSQREKQGLSLLQRFRRWRRAVVHSAVTKLRNWSTIRWGRTMPWRMSQWINHLVYALEVGHTTDIYDPNQHDLQTMCVARHLQGQGVGTIVLKKIQSDLASTEGAVGIQGLCQSESTKTFYEKTGFQTREVWTNPPELSRPGTLRKHWFVGWNVEDKISI